MNVIAWSHNLTDEICNQENVKYVNQDFFFQSCDILSIHTKLSERTQNFVNYEKMSLMKKILQ